MVSEANISSNEKKKIFWSNVITFLDECKIPRKKQITHFNNTLDKVNKLFPCMPQKIRIRFVSLYNDYTFNHNDKETVIDEIMYYSILYTPNI